MDEFIYKYNHHANHKNNHLDLVFLICLPPNAKRISFKERAVREGFVDANHLGRGAAVGVRDVAAAEGGNVETLTEIGSDVVRAY